MPDQNQAPEHKRGEPPEPELGPAPEPPPATEPPTTPPPPYVRDWMVVEDPAARRARRGLMAWFLTLIVIGIAGIAAGQLETAALVALGTLYAAAQAAEVDARSRLSYLAVAWIVPSLAVLAFVGLAWYMLRSGLSGPAQVVAAGSSVLAAVLSVAALLPGAGAWLSRAVFRGTPPSAPLQLTARLTLYSFLLAIPAWVGFETIRESVLEDPSKLLGPYQLSGGLLGYLMLAAGGVGWLTRRTTREALERLGVRRLRLRDAGVVALGVVALVVLNTGGDALQHRFFPQLWAHDREFTRAIAGSLSLPQALLLGLSAGVGEEITVRGALQPRLGLVLTSLLFAVLHVQYSWFGIVMIVMLGLILGLIRQRSSTSVAILVHAIYDVLAVLEKP